MLRNIDLELYKWSMNTDHKPLLIMGARQVGKTTSITMFCKENYEHYYYTNLFNDKTLIDIYNQNIGSEKKLELLKLALNISKPSENSILFVDEVQESEEFISDLKYLNEKHPEINIICSGSLLGVKFKRFSSSFPVGQIDLKYMYPMNFEEFLLNTENEEYIHLIDSAYLDNTPVNNVIHEKLLNLYKVYLCIGGLPESVKNYIKINKDLSRYNKNILKSIRKEYIEDMKKYVTSNNETIKIEKIYNSVPHQIENLSDKFQYSKIENNAKSNLFELPLDWLFASKIVLKSNCISKPENPLNGFISDTTFKVFYNDVGMLNSFLDVKFLDILQDKLLQYKGAINENYVATQLISNDIPLNYWRSENKSEIDFIIENEHGVIPIEVKAGKSVKSKSLSVYMKKFNPKYAIRISNKNFGFENNIKSVPSYAVHCIKQNKDYY
ncbi:MAG: AAA family ATPase [Bifidobacteriaceae bacterium]|jgi:predicted AAA+ superfamily ATPase|nr:AAA family ATPase [Bifidobacteriaceae bacterium]